MIEAHAVEPGVVVVQSKYSEDVHSPEYAEELANKYTDPVRSELIQAVSDARELRNQNYSSTSR